MVMYFARRRVRLSNFGGAFPSFNDALCLNQSPVNECLAPSLARSNGFYPGLGLSLA